MKFKDQEVPERAIDLWRGQIERASDEAVIGCTACYKFMAAGFRSGRVPAANLRSQLFTMLEGKGEIPAPLLDTIRAVGLTDSVVKVLSVIAIELVHEELATYYGEPFYAALLIDGRDELWRLAERKFKELPSGEPEQHDRQQSARNVLKKLRHFIQAFSELIDFGSVEATKKDTLRKTDDLAKNSEQIIKLKRDLVSIEKQLKKANISKERRDAELNDLRSKLEASERSRNKATKEYQELTIRYTGLFESFTERVETEVSRRTDERVIPWLPKVERQMALLTSNDFQVIEERAKHFLDLQAADNKIYQTRAGLRSVLRRLQGLRDEVSDALLDSIRPRKDLKSVLKSIEAEIRRIKGVLDPSSVKEVSATCIELLQRVSMAESLDELAVIRGDKAKLVSESKLDQHEAKIVSERIHTTSDMFYRDHSRNHPDKDLNTALLKLPSVLVRLRLGKGSPVKLIVDGHNVLFTLDDIFGNYYEDDIPAELARAELTSRIDTVCQQFTSLTVDLWFDSSSASRVTISEKLSIFYSGGVGKNRADDQIIKSLEALSSTSVFLDFVVTDDQDLGDRARAMGTQVISCDEFFGLIQ